MNIIIIGAGELGQLVAAKLCSLNHDVVVVDTNPENLEAASESLDTGLLVGAATDVEVLKRAGAKDADLLLALSGDEPSNVLACAIAKRLGTKKAICRVFSRHVFSEADGITPASFHIDHVFSSIDESVEMIYGILQNRILQQRITFQNPDALVDVVNIPLNCALAGVPIRSLSEEETLKKVRLAAIIRKRELIVPHGDTVLMPGDKLYVAGREENVTAFVEWLSHDRSVPLESIVVAGLSPIAQRLLLRLQSQGLKIRIIEQDGEKAEKMLSQLHQGNPMVFQGEITNPDILSEADVDSCDVFAALSSRDENNILACLLASRLGAKKVIALTSTAEYMDILPSLEQAGCWFNTTQIAANGALRLLSNQTIRVDPELRALNARIVELILTEKSSYVGKRIMDCGLPQGFLIALTLRGDQVITPTGDTVNQAGDQWIVFTGSAELQQVRRHI
ncbi:MAG: Trk system potassium transporter TrkA [Oligosphaeraceae bacterium]